MKIMFNLIDECAQQFIQHFKEQQQKVVELEMKDTLSRYTNDVIATAAFGLQCNSLKDRENDFYLMGKDANDFSGLRIFKFLLYAISPTLSKVIFFSVLNQIFVLVCSSG